MKRGEGWWAALQSLIGRRSVGPREDIHDVAAQLRKRIASRALPRGASAEDLIREDRDDPDR